MKHIINEFKEFIMRGNVLDLAVGVIIGGAFQKIAEFLPFIHCVNALRAALEGNYSQIIPELLWVFGYAAVIFACAVLLFNRRMKQDK